MGSHSLLQGVLPNPGMEPRSPALQVDSVPSEPSGTPIWLLFISTKVRPAAQVSEDRRLLPVWGMGRVRAVSRVGYSSSRAGASDASRGLEMLLRTRDIVRGHHRQRL